LLVAGLSLVAIAPNLYLMRERGEDLRADSAETQVRLTALESAGDNAYPEFGQVLTFPVRGADYLAAAERYGGFGEDPVTLLRGGPGAQKLADSTLASILNVSVVPAVEPSENADCKTIGVNQVSEGVTLPLGGATLTTEEPSTVRLRRYDSGPGFELATIPSGQPRRIAIPTDSDSTPWQALLPNAGAVEVCALEDPPG
jgi:hypothetical protein